MAILCQKNGTLRAAASVAAAIQLPVVSVIIVSCNHSAYLRQAVESIRGQTYPNVECIVVDNASTDESPSILADIEKQFPNVNIIGLAKNEGETAARSPDSLPVAGLM